MKIHAIFFVNVLFFAFGFFALSGDNVAADVFVCTHNGQSGTCVSDSSRCSNGSVYGNTECQGNNEQTLCCILQGSGGQTPCTASDGGGNGYCYAENSCPTGLFYHRSLDCLGATPACCTNSAGGSCQDTANHCKASCADYGGTQAGCENACPAGTGSYCRYTTAQGSCPALNSYCKSDCSDYGGENSACVGKCDETTATTGLKYCNKSTTGGGEEEVDTKTGWTGGLTAIKTESGLPSKTIREIVKGLLLWILGIFGFIAIIGFVIAGILYLTAAGNSKQIETAKMAMKWSIVGVIVALMGYVIVLAADFLLRGSV